MLEDILKDTPLYQHIRAGGLDEGRETERERELRSLQQELLTLLQELYPNLSKLAQKKLALIKEPEDLERLVFKVARARNESDVKQYLSMIKTRRGR